MVAKVKELLSGDIVKKNAKFGVHLLLSFSRICYKYPNVKSYFKKFFHANASVKYLRIKYLSLEIILMLI